MKKSILDGCIAKECSCKDGAKMLNMHEKAFSRLKRRYLAEGEAALVPRKPGPKRGSPANRTPEWIEDLAVDIARRHRSWGPAAIAGEIGDSLGISIDQSTAYRILKRKGARYFRDYAPEARPAPKLYCLDDPGREVQLDGCCPFGRARKLVAFDAVDDCSRFAFSKCYDRETAGNAILFATEVAARAPFRVRAFRVDNRYGRAFREYCEGVLGVEVIANDPYCPKQNGKVERFNKTIKHRFFWASCSFGDSMDEINYKLAFWLDSYNYRRRHGGYGMDRMTPAQKVSVSLMKEASNALIINHPKVTGILQQYISCFIFYFMLYSPRSQF
jgi:transposase